MAYFNHAFNKVFLGTKNANGANANQSTGVAPDQSGFVIGGAYGTKDLIGLTPTVPATNLGLGSYGFFDPTTWQVMPLQTMVSNPTCCPLVLAAAALYQKDNIGPFAGGYQESNKSKVINPRYISQFYRVDPCQPNQNVVHVGATPYTAANSQDCCFTFLCDQTYNLRIDIKGSPALRFLDRNSYYTTASWTGCCPPNALAPVAVDPTTVYIAWATQLIGSPLIAPFIKITVYDQAGASVGGPNDLAAWAAYVPQAVIPCAPGAPGAGMTIIGAYVDTKFGDCTFYPTDFFEKEPVHIYASMVDLTGSVCDFTGVCVTEQCCPRQGNGFGETVLRDLIMSERYLQNDFYTGTDLRIREITQGYDITNAVNRNAFYTRYYILHNVPRFNNPTGVFDNDQYMLEIITNGLDSNLESFMSSWMGACGPCPSLEIHSCGPCCPVIEALPNAVFSPVPVAYNQVANIINATGPFTFVGAPYGPSNGLTFNANGTITGTPVAAGVSTFTVVFYSASCGSVLAPFTQTITVTAV